MNNHIFVETPLGKVWVLESEGAIVGLMYGDEEALRTFEIKHSLQESLNKQTPLLKKAKQQLDEYFEGKRMEFDLVLRPAGTKFQQQAWDALQKIPFGKTRSYGEQAEQIGNKKACRAIGQANNRNPISIIVPCHRVVASNGALTGYAFGIDRKQWLLDHEAASC